MYEEGEVQGTIAELMTEQVEFSNVVVLNKNDLVDKDQQQDILDRIALLNPKAKVLKSVQSKINVLEILNTRLFNRADMEEDSVMISATKVAVPEQVEDPKCCTISLAEGGKKCCKSKSKNNQLLDSGLSQVQLGVVPNNNGNQQTTRHEKRFGITSFIYRARRPFHPGRIYHQFMEPFFMLRYEEEEGPELRSHLDKLQKQAAVKQEKRVKFMGELLRSKGFIWIATSNFIMGGFQQAGNVLRVEGEGPWMCEIRDVWEGGISEALVRKDLNQENGEEFPYADRRQELVFIGIKLDHAAIQKCLDECLLTDDEMNMGPEKWEETWAEEDKIQLSLDDEDDDEEGDEEDDQEDDTDKDLGDESKGVTEKKPKASEDKGDESKGSRKRSRTNEVKETNGTEVNGDTKKRTKT